MVINNISEFKHYVKPLLIGLKKYLHTPKLRSGLVVGMMPWKEQLNGWVLESSYIQINRHFTHLYFLVFLKPYLKIVNPVIYIWGYKAPPFFIDYLRHNNLDVFFLEDGFIRSTPKYDKNTPPLSIVMDSQAPYFDTTRPNDLTDLIKGFDFSQTFYDEELLIELFDYFLSHRVSKYNYQPFIDVHQIYGVKDRRRVLILDQVKEDASLKYGGGSEYTLMDIVNKVREDYPNAQIIIKPHPMTLEDESIISTLRQHDCMVLSIPLHLVDALQTVDHVYTITSLGGFEALLRGKEVTVLGNPFYKSLCDKNLREIHGFLLCYIQYG